MVVRTHVPEAGDLIWVDFDPTKGKEQAAHRPAIIISPKSYNKKSGLAIACPITSRVKNYPFEVLVEGNDIKGAVLVDQVRSIDYRARKIKFVEVADSDVFREVQDKLILLIKN